MDNVCEFDPLLDLELGDREVSNYLAVADHIVGSQPTPYPVLTDQWTIGENISVGTLIYFTQRIGLNMGNFEDLVYSLNNQNYLLKKGPKLYQLQTASCL